MGHLNESSMRQSIVMDPQPPTCVFSCCNVRTSTLTVSHINIIFFTVEIFVSIFKIFDENRSLEITLPCLLVFVVFLILNLQLRRGVLERDIGPLLLWLQVYLTLFVINAIGMFSYVFTDQNKFDTNRKQFIEIAFKYAAIYNVISIFWMYSVYSNYDFEKRLFQKNRKSEYQIL